MPSSTDSASPASDSHTRDAETAGLDPDQAQEVKSHLQAQTEEMLSFLEALVRAESPTDVPEAQAEVQRLLTSALQDAGLAVRHLPGEGVCGGHLYARPEDASGWRKGGRPLQLLLGHSDTVWSRSTIETMPFQVDRDEGVVRGPGVFDMKAGLTQMVFALQALREHDVSLPVTPVVFINSDEESGSFHSKRHVHRLARAVDRAFVVEPALGVDGKIKTARKGAGRFTVAIKGKSAHAGLDPESGSSAILELSHVVQKLNEINDPESGLVVNVGTIGGGTRPNVVAAEGSAEVDVRIRTQEQAETVEKAIRGLKSTIPGTTLEISGSIGRPPMERTPGSRRLWAQVQAAAERLGLDPLEEGRSGGVSDGNLAAQHTPTLDGLGAVGDGAHAEHEFCYIDAMAERSALLAVLLTMPLDRAS